MGSDWVLIYETTNPIEAEIILSMLNENGVHAVEMNKRDSSYQTFGNIQLYCPQNVALTAVHLIKENNNAYDK